MSKHSKAETRESAFELYIQKVRAHFQNQVANLDLRDKDVPCPPPPMPKDIIAKYAITREEMQQARKIALDSLAEDARQSRENKLI